MPDRRQYTTSPRKPQAFPRFGRRAVDRRTAELSRPRSQGICARSAKSRAPCRALPRAAHARASRAKYKRLPARAFRAICGKSFSDRHERKHSPLFYMIITFPAIYANILSPLFAAAAITGAARAQSATKTKTAPRGAKSLTPSGACAKGAKFSAPLRTPPFGFAAPKARPKQKQHPKVQKVGPYRGLAPEAQSSALRCELHPSGSPRQKRGQNKNSTQRYKKAGPHRGLAPKAQSSPLRCEHEPFGFAAPKARPKQKAQSKRLCFLFW